MSIDGMTVKQIRRLEKGYHCPICGRRYEDRHEAEECKRECRRQAKAVKWDG